MNITKLLLVFLITIFCCSIIKAQVVLNEVSNKNSGQIADEDEEYNDWIELYNTSASTINLAGYYLSDDSLNLEKWPVPSYKMASFKHLVIFASGKNKTMPPGSYHWESPVLYAHLFDYIVPNAETPVNWMMPDFITTGWKQGQGGFGFGDNDDATVIPGTSMAVYVRKSFNLPAGFDYIEVALHVDYDDGFVAYLNGTEIGRRKINGTPTWNSPASGEREARMYSGAQPEKIDLDTALIRSLLVEGPNVFAIEAHNYLPASIDLSLKPFLSFRINNSLSLFDKTPVTLITSGVTNLHTNFKIDSKGEKVYLYNKTANNLETVWVDIPSAGWSMGRVTDGADEMGIFIQPSPSKPNTSQVFTYEREPEPIISVAEGYYTTSQKIYLSTSSSTAQIRYTTNGDEPKMTSTLYNGTALTVSSSRIIRATCFSKTNKLPSRPVSNTYFINNSGHTVPVLSIITDHSNLFNVTGNSTGIFDNWSMEWERPCYVEYFDNKAKLFEQSAGIQVDGGAGGSRSQAQHSFRLEFNNGTFGEGDVDEVLIPDRPDRNDYKSIYLRNGSNQFLRFQFKDAMETKMMSFNTLNSYSACTPAVVYINGSYFGLYEMREKLNDEFFEKNYNATIDSTFHLLSLSWYYKSVLRALNGSVDTFTVDYSKFLALNQADLQYLDKADKIIDLDYYTDYIIAQSWIADTDWPFNNIKIVKGGFTDHKWRFVLQDLEWSLKPNGWTDSDYDHIKYMLNYSLSVPYLRFWRELIKNTTYKRKFLNRFADIMNTSYLPVNTTAIAQSLYDASYPEMRAEYVKWAGESNANWYMTQYENNLDTFKYELNNRSTVVRNNIVYNFKLTGKYNLELQTLPESAGVIQINTITPQVYPWSGIYFAGIPIKMEAKGTGNYVFDGWEPNAIIKDVNNPVIEADIKTSGYKFTAKFKLKAPEQAITISEVNYVSGDKYPASDWVELLNYGSNGVDMTGWYITDSDPTHKWIFPGSVTLPAGERLVLASNLSKFQAVYPTVSNVIGSFDFGLGTPTDQVNIYNSSNELIAGVEYTNSAPWPTGAFDKGMTLELKDPNLGLNNPGNWFDGCEGGSPGVTYKNCTTGILASAENNKATIYPNPATDQINVILPTNIGNQTVTFRIMDMMGKQVKILTEQYAGQKSLGLSIHELVNGIYILRISYGNDEQILKFIKKRE